jgi:DNA-binding transcriptional regulator YiaG
VVVGLLGNKSPDSNRFTLVTPKSENDVRLQATLANQNPTGLPVGTVSAKRKAFFMEIYTTSEFAKKIGVSVSTLRRWDKDGILIAHRKPSGRRFYMQDQYEEYISRFTVPNNFG